MYTAVNNFWIRLKSVFDNEKTFSIAGNRSQLRNREGSCTSVLIVIVMVLILVVNVIVGTLVYCTIWKRNAGLDH